MKLNLLKPLALLAGMAAATAANAQVKFAPQVTYGSTISEYNDVAIGDMNGDGKPDIVTNGNGGVSVLLAIGNGGYSQTFYNVPGRSVAIEDMNGDGRPDIVAWDYNDNIDVLLADGNDGYTVATYATNLSNQEETSSVTIADMNGDGSSDIVVAAGDIFNIAVLLSDSNGGYTTATYFTGNFPAFAAVADINGDGKQDIVTVNDYSNNVSILPGNGDGSFQPQTTYPTGSNPLSVTTADFNGDGKTDLAIANNQSSNVSVLLGKGDGSFQPQITYPTGGYAYSVTTADFNGDGKTDIVAASQGSNNVSILLGNGDGSFNPQGTYATGIRPFSVTAGDLNGDGMPDIVTANGGGGASVLLNTTPFATPVTLQSFTGALKQGMAKLQWATAVEANCNHFEISAQTGNSGFITVASVSAKGSNSHYTYSLSQTAPSVNYRLKMVDNDGRATYSDVLTLSQKGSGTITVYPNPAASNINISVSAAGNYQLINMTGNTVLKGNLVSGNNCVNVGNLPAGVYILRVGNESHRVLVER